MRQLWGSPWLLAGGAACLHPEALELCAASSDRGGAPLGPRLVEWPCLHQRPRSSVPPAPTAGRSFLGVPTAHLRNRGIILPSTPTHQLWPQD